MNKVTSNNVNKLPLAISMGEPAGVGPELILKIWAERERNKTSPFVVVGDAEYFSDLAAELKLDVPVEACDAAGAIQIFENALPIIPLPGKIKGSPNTPSTQDGKLICAAIENSVDLVMEGKCAGVVTAPINKNELYEAGFVFPGHTEYLAHIAAKYTNVELHPVMMLAGPQLRAVPVTIHIALSDVPKALTSELIVKTGEIVANNLREKFGIASPRIAIAGLNPHAGENGSMGMEDIEIVKPAIDALKDGGINAFGPLPADTLFHAKARETYDAVLCMYHDQALIPAKTLAFDESVNVTLGLPFIRTSPDHGTAYDIAGKGIANPSSMIAAIKLAGQMADQARGKNR